MKKLFELLIVCTMAMVLAACGPTDKAKNSKVGTKEEIDATVLDSSLKSKDEKISLTIYAQYIDEDTKIPYDYAVAELAKAYPNVTLELDIQAQDGGRKLNTYAATGSLPDIFDVKLAQINTLKNSGNIFVLDDYIKSTGFGDRLTKNSENLLWNEDGHAYAFPYAGNELVLLYYNKVVFEKYGVKVPENYEELKAAVITFSQNDIVPLSIFAEEGWITTALYDIFATRLISKGIAGLDQGEALASDEPYKIAAEQLKELVDLGLVAEDATNTSYNQAAALFYDGKAAMFINGQWEIQASTLALGDDVDWMWYPAFTDNPRTSYAMSGGGVPGGYAVSPYSKHIEMATEVAAFIAQKYCEAKYKFRANPLIALKVEGVTPEVATPPMMTKLENHLDEITSTSSFAWGLTNATFKTVIEEQTQLLLTKEYTVEEFIREVDKSIER